MKNHTHVPTRWSSFALLVGLLSVACGSSSAPSAAGSSPSPQASATVLASASPSPSNGGTTLYTFAPEPGSSVGGTVQMQSTSAGVTLTARVTGLKPGHAYLADADPLPCDIFAGGPSQSFPVRFTADASGRTSVTWTVPTGMNGNANIQVLNGGAYVVLACADLG